MAADSGDRERIRRILSRLESVFHSKVEMRLVMLVVVMMTMHVLRIERLARRKMWRRAIHMLRRRVLRAGRLRRQLGVRQVRKRGGHQCRLKLTR